MVGSIPRRDDSGDCSLDERSCWLVTTLSCMHYSLKPGPKQHLQTSLLLKVKKNANPASTISACFLLIFISCSHWMVWRMSSDERYLKGGRYKDLFSIFLPNSLPQTFLLDDISVTVIHLDPR